MLKLYICIMVKLFSARRIFLILGFILSMQSFASFIHSDNGSKKKTSSDISLKNFTRNSYRNTAYPDFRLSKFQFKGSTNIYQFNTSNAVVGQSFIRMENGNTAYVYPYKYKVKVPLFKTPSQPNGNVH